MRFLGHTLFTAAALLPGLGWKLVQTRHPGLQLLRTLLLPIMTALNFWALRYLQLAEVGAILFLAPILVAVLGHSWLGERLDPGRWLAIVIGFMGVLIVLQPGSGGFHPAMLLSLLQTALYAIFIVLTRVLAADDRPQTSNFLSALGASVLLAPFALMTWQTPAGALEWAVIGLTGLAGGLGHHLLAFAPRYAPASTIAPFIYFQMIYMILLGYFVFGDVPSAAVMIGGSVVIACGLFLVWSERRVGR